jgi:predicted permease
MFVGSCVSTWAATFVRSDESGPSLVLDVAIVFFTTTTTILADIVIQASRIFEHVRHNQHSTALLAAKSY